MGSSGGDQTSSSAQATQNRLPAWAVPYAKELAGAGANLYLPGGSPGQMPSNLNQQYAGLNPDETAAISGITGQTGTANGLGSQSAGLASSILAGDQLNPTTNPYLTDTYNEGAQSLINSYQTAIAPGNMAAGEVASGGGPGFANNSGFQQEQALNQYGLGQNLNNLATNIYGGAYEQGIQNQQNTLQGIGNIQNSLYTGANEQLGVGTLEQQNTQSGYNTQYTNALNANQYPMQQLSGFGSILQQAIGNAGSSVTLGNSTSPAGGGMK
jgi:hypothetical protein